METSSYAIKNTSSFSFRPRRESALRLWVVSMILCLTLGMLPTQMNNLPISSAAVSTGSTTSIMASISGTAVSDETAELRNCINPDSFDARKCVAYVRAELNRPR